MTWKFHHKFGQVLSKVVNFYNLKIFSKRTSNKKNWRPIFFCVTSASKLEFDMNPAPAFVRIRRLPGFG